MAADRWTGGRPWPAQRLPASGNAGARIRTADQLRERLTDLPEGSRMAAAADRGQLRGCPEGQNRKPAGASAPGGETGPRGMIVIKILLMMRAARRKPGKAHKSKMRGDFRKVREKGYYTTFTQLFSKGTTTPERISGRYGKRNKQTRRWAFYVALPVQGPALLRI